MLGLMVVPGTPASAEVKWLEDFYSLRASWAPTVVADHPRSGLVTMVEVTASATDGLRFLEADLQNQTRNGTPLTSPSVCLAIDTEVVDSETGERMDFTHESGCTEPESITVAEDLSSASLTGAEVPLERLVRICPPGDPGTVDCVFESEPSRVVTFSAEWTAVTESLAPFLFCFRGMTGTYVTDRGAVATGALGGDALGESIPNDVFTWLYHYTAAAGCHGLPAGYGPR